LQCSIFFGATQEKLAQPSLQRNQFRPKRLKPESAFLQISTLPDDKAVSLASRIDSIPPTKPLERS
jgi:hypothetical protein